MLDPGTVVGIPYRRETHQAFYLAFEPVSGREFFYQARKGRILGRGKRLYDKIFGLLPIARIDPEPPSKGRLVRRPFSRQQGVFLLERLRRFSETRPRRENVATSEGDRPSTGLHRTECRLHGFFQFALSDAQSPSIFNSPPVWSILPEIPG
jgi:hypothetical protein